MHDKGLKEGRDKFVQERQVKLEIIWLSLEGNNMNEQREVRKSMGSSGSMRV